MIRRKAPVWIERYKKDYEDGRITMEEIYRQENAEREAENKPLLKPQSVKRALNALSFSSAPFKSVKTEEPKPSTKPCFGCRYYTSKYICVYPRSMFAVYLELSDFDKDFSEGRCQLKEK